MPSLSRWQLSAFLILEVIFIIKGVMFIVHIQCQCMRDVINGRKHQIRIVNFMYINKTHKWLLPQIKYQTKSEARISHNSSNSKLHKIGTYNLITREQSQNFPMCILSGSINQEHGKISNSRLFCAI